MWQTERGTALGLPLRGGISRCLVLPCLSHIRQGVYGAQTPVLSLWFVHAIPFAPNVLSSLSPGKLRLPLKPEHKCLFFQNILKPPDWTRSCPAWPLEEPTTTSPSVCPPPRAKAQRNGILFLLGAPASDAEQSADLEWGTARSSEVRTELRQVDNGVGRACAFFLKTSFEDFLVVGSLPANAGSMGSISFMGRFHVRQSIRAPGPQLLAPQRSAPRPASPTARPHL